MFCRLVPRCYWWLAPRCFAGLFLGVIGDLLLDVFAGLFLGVIGGLLLDVLPACS